MYLNATKHELCKVRAQMLLVVWTNQVLSSPINESLKIMELSLEKPRSSKCRLPACHGIRRKIPVVVSMIILFGAASVHFDASDGTK